MKKQSVLIATLLSLTLFTAIASAETYKYLLPNGPATDQIIEHTHYTLGYDEQTEQAEWVIYEFTPAEANGPKYERTDDFRPDPNVSTGSASLADYKGSGYDRGHMAPAGDMAFSPEAMSESFYLSNMSPQDPTFNRGTWKNLESLVRSWAKSQTVIIVTGPVLKGTQHIGENNVLVPAAYYKIAYLPDKNSAIAFLLPNNKGDGDLSHWVVSVNDIETVTGIDFFSGMDDQQEETVEGNINTNHWYIPTRKAKATTATTRQSQSERYTPPARTTSSSSNDNIVKKTASGICHDQGSRYYSRTQKFTPYKSLQECLDSGGRLPKQ